MTEIKFSIGIPAFKDVFFKKCIDSILNQTYSNFELIIVNDASPNDLKSIVNEFNDGRIRYFENETNVGAENVVLNWNTCLDKATGDFFILMGDDDMMAPNYLEEFYQLIQNYPDLDVYHCRSLIVDEEDYPKELTHSWPEFETIYENIYHRLRGERKQYISDFVYRTSHLNSQNGFYYLPLAWCSDDLTAYRACGSKGIAHINKPVFKYRSNSFSITSTGNSQKKMEATLKAFDEIPNFLNEAIPQNDIEGLMYKNLVSRLPIFKSVQKRNVMVDSFKSGFLKNLLIWVKLHREYKIKFKEFIWSIFSWLKLNYKGSKK